MAQNINLKDRTYADFRLPKFRKTSEVSARVHWHSLVVIYNPLAQI